MISAPITAYGRTPYEPFIKRSVLVSEPADTPPPVTDGSAGLRAFVESSTSDREVPAAGYVVLKEMVHELRDPLSVILLVAERALHGKHNCNVVDALVLIREETVRAERIMQGTIERASTRGVSKVVGNLNSAAQHAVATAKRYCNAWPQNRLTWALDLTEPAARVLMNAVAIEQVILNLIKNAVESSESALRIVVRTVNTPERAEVIVSDNGGGIPRDTLPRVFERFVSTKREKVGRGLGLSICNEIVTDHGGQILVESEVGRGSVFTIQLPYAAFNPAGTEWTRDDVARRFDARRIGRSMKGAPTCSARF